VKCETFRDGLERFRDGDQPPGEADEFRRHLQTCPACQDLDGSDRELTTLLREVYRDEGAAAEGFAAALEASCRRFRGPRGRLALFRGLAWGSAAAALILAAVLLLFSGPRFRVRIHQTSGPVSLTGGSTGGMAAHASLDSGSGLATEGGAEALVTVGGGAAVRLRERSDLRVVADGRLRLDRGAALVSVEQGPLTIETPDLELRSESGTFLVRVDGKGASMTRPASFATAATVVAVASGAVYYVVQNQNRQVRAAELARAVQGEQVQVSRLEELEQQNRKLQSDLQALRAELIALKAAQGKAKEAPVREPEKKAEPEEARGGVEPEKKGEPGAKPASLDELKGRFTKVAKKGIDFLMNRGEFEELAKAFTELGAEGLHYLGDMLLKAESLQEKYLAAHLMEAMEDPAALAYIEQSLDRETDPFLRRFNSHAAAMLAREQDAPLLERIVNDRQMDHGARINAAYGLARLGREAGFDYLIEAARGGDPMMRMASLGAVLTLDSPRIAPLAREQLTTEGVDLGMRLLAIQALGRIRDQAALPLLERIVSGSYPESLKEEARAAIQRILGR